MVYYVHSKGNANSNRDGNTLEAYISLDEEQREDLLEVVAVQQAREVFKIIFDGLNKIMDIRRGLST